MATERKQIDWERIELDYRAGVLSVREIAAQHGITHGAINKRAKRDGWDRDLSAKIKAKADTLVSKAEVSKEVSAEKADTERRTIESNAQAIADIRIGHRKDISRLKSLVMALLKQLEDETGDPETFSALGEMMRREDDKGVDKLNDLYHKVISLPQRIDGIKKLSETLKTLISLEREAWGLASEEDKPSATPFGEMLKELDGTSKGLPGGC